MALCPLPPGSAHAVYTATFTMWCPDTPHTARLLSIVPTTRDRGWSERSAPRAAKEGQPGVNRHWKSCKKTQNTTALPAVWSACGLMLSITCGIDVGSMLRITCGIGAGSFELGGQKSLSHFRLHRTRRHIVSATIRNGEETRLSKKKKNPSETF